MPMSKLEEEEMIRKNLSGILKKEEGLVELSGSASFEDLLVAVKQWADSHPSPDSPVIFVGGKELNARKIANHFERQDRFGKLLLAIIQQAITSGHKLEEIISAFKNNKNRKNPPSLP